MKRSSIHTAGFTLVEIMIVVAIIGLLAAISIPNFMHARATSQASACINNLREIDASKQQWALELKQALTVVPTGTDIQPYLGRGTGGMLPFCPLDSTKVFSTSYTLGDIQTVPICQIAGSGASGNITNHILQ